MRFFVTTVLTVLLLPAMISVSAAPAASSSHCAAIMDNADRLQCYDQAYGHSEASTMISANTGSHKTIDVTVPTTPPNGIGALAIQHYNLNDEDKSGVFHFMTHRPNYILPVHYSDSPNDRPSSPSLGATVSSPPGLNNAELKYQLSFKTKLLENILFDRADLWFAYTQQSHWQIYHASESRPFRETNYEPELMLLFPTNYDVLGLHGRFLNIGLDHQSNGQSNQLSRSWNRAYLQAEFDHGNFGWLFKRWWHLPNNHDDNPDITNYLGHIELISLYKQGGNLYSLTLRNNLQNQNNYGSAQFDWSFPLYQHLKGYVQVFSGYGESLIDYNHRQNVIGVGIVLTDWL